MKFSTLQNQRLATIAIIVFAICIYGYAVLTTGFVDWDDTYLIINNPDIKAINSQTIQNVFTTFDPELYMPLTFISYQINYAMAGLQPAVYLITNLILHIICALLLQKVLARLTQHPWIAWLVAFVFIAHPMHTEIVLWASARKDVLAMAFYLSSILLYLRFDEDHNSQWWNLCVLMGLLAMLSKAMAITLPVFLVCIDVYKHRKLDYKFVWNKKFMFFLAFSIGLIAIIGKQRVVGNYILTDKLLISTKGAFFSLWRMFIPTKFAIMHPQIGPVSIATLDFLIPIFGLALVAITSIATYRKIPAIMFGFFVYFMTLSPTFLGNSESADIYITYDRYNYIASIGIYFLLAMFFVWLLKQAKNKWSHKGAQILSVTYLLFLITLAGLSVRQSTTWASNERMLQNVIDVYPTWYTTYDKLGNIYFKRAQSEKNDALYATALHYYKKALSLNPDSPRVLTNIGALYSATNQPEKELEAYTKAVSIEKNYPPSQYNLARAYEDAGKLDLALDHLLQVEQLNPNFYDTNIRIANLYMQKEDYISAKNMFVKILTRDPKNKDAEEGLQLAESALK